MTESANKVESGILQALIALDNQVAREMQRDPQQVSEQGVQKWQPHDKRIESLMEIILDNFDEGKIQLDSILISAQGLVHALTILIEDLGLVGLGELRRNYCLAAIDRISRNIEQAGRVIKEQRELN